MATWFLIDIAFYGNGVSSHLILQSTVAHANLIQTTEITFIIFLLTAFPGYLVAARWMDSMGRKPIQGLGFFMMSLLFATICIFPAVIHSTSLFIILYGLSYFFIEFGPNTTTFLFPSELFPTYLRATGHGFAAAGGKLGAFIAALLFPTILNLQNGLVLLFALLAFAASLGFFLTLLLPEPKRRALEDINENLRSGAAHSTYSRIMHSLHNENLDMTIANELRELSNAECILIYRLSEQNHWQQSAISAGQYRLEQAFAEAENERSRITPLLTSCVDQHALIVKNELTQLEATRYGLPSWICSLVAFPLLDSNRCFGILLLLEREPHMFSDERIHKLSLFIHIAAPALAHTSRFLDMKRQAFTDALTQLPNRSGFEHEFETRITSENRMAFVILDLDNFKQVNDTLGHQKGDEALQDVASHLKKAIRARDLVARLGGDEFILLLDNIERPEDTVEFLERLTQSLPLLKWQLGVSAGVSFYPLDGRSYQELYRVADSRLYFVKDSGKGRVNPVDTHGTIPLTLHTP
ncbi:MFS transporter [Ferroacidibacillus organovorans]|uniref:MFS transporter n=1 Tax=Ferroacidibacillus organovorans TaxID=1765683 RepID=UPI001365562D|nr:MFS transporter [Ferroacidibacillus organovorans]